MDTGAKITLSPKELELVCNTDWILTKHAIIQKVYRLFGELLPQLEAQLQAHSHTLPAEVFLHAPKIAKGENYQLLPYVVLDYPRYFTKEEVFAIRHFFWWGNFFSISLQLSGKFRQRFMPALQNNFELLQQGGYWLCIAEEPWQHHFADSNFRLIEKLSREEFADMLTCKPFVKIAKKMSLQQWEEIPLFIAETFGELTRLLKDV